MPSRRSDVRRACARLAGLLLGACTVLPAPAFTPISGPILSTTLVVPNVMVLLDNSSSMLTDHQDGQSRLAVARNATRAAIANNRHLRFGLFGFRQATLGDRGPGGELLVEVGSVHPDSAEGIARFDALNRALDGLNPEPGSTQGAPLAESWYEVTRYFRGMPAFYPQNGEASQPGFDSPIEYRCQNNLGLIVTAGLPTHDDQFPDNLTDEPDGNNPRLQGSFNLPDWDGDNADLVPGAGPGTEGGAFYLDDIARFAHETDLRRGGLDGAGRSWDDPQFPIQNLRTYTLGFTLDDPRLAQVASAGNGRYFTASDHAQLQEVLAQALRDANTTVGSGGGASSDSGQLVAGTSRYYQTRFDSSDWSGSLNAYHLNSEGQPAGLLWSTDSTFISGPQPGTMQTWRRAEGQVPGRAVTLDQDTWATLAPVQQHQWETEALLAGLPDNGQGQGQRLLNWVQGSADAGLRSRNRLLGDVINSAPVLAGAGQPAQPDNPHPGYAAYREKLHGDMAEAILIGANDGFLRMFDSHGAHLYSYLPAAAHAGMGLRARPDYGQGNQHRSGVDGRIAVADVQLGGRWSTLAAAGLGAGGRGLFSLRLFDEHSGAGARGVLWETDPQLEVLGHIYDQPAMLRLHGQPVLITGNGYGSKAQRAALLIFDLYSGALLRQLEVSDREGANGANGLSAPVLQFDAHGELQAAFAGDLHGQLWKFDLGRAEPDSWRVAHAGRPLFTAAEGQAITVQPRLHPDLTGDADLLLFGTGKFLESVDLSDTRLQAFYAVLDTPSLPAGGLTPASLQRQRVSSVPGPESGRSIRTVDASPVDWNSQYGWYLPLEEVPGERVTRTAVIRHSRVMFTTGFIESEAGDPCRTRAGGWLMSVALASGGMTTATILDTNADGRVDRDDSPAAGLELDVGLPGQLSVMDRDEEGQPSGCSAEFYLVQGSAEVTALRGQPHCQFSRIMWRQLQ